MSTQDHPCGAQRAGLGSRSRPAQAGPGRPGDPTRADLGSQTPDHVQTQTSIAAAVIWRLAYEIGPGPRADRAGAPWQTQGRAKVCGWPGKPPPFSKGGHVADLRAILWPGLRITSDLPASRRPGRPRDRPQPHPLKGTEDPT